jgi:hypothetical protein
MSGSVSRKKTWGGLLPTQPTACSGPLAEPVENGEHRAAGVRRGASLEGRANHRMAAAWLAVRKLATMRISAHFPDIGSLELW